MRWTNWYTHPGDNRYRVFTFGKLEHADEFAADLDDAGIEHERHLEGEEHLFGLHRRDFKPALRLNNLLHARHRTAFISNRIFRWGLLLFTAAAVAIAVIGYFLSS